jgi:hypothetical protein
MSKPAIRKTIRRKSTDREYTSTRLTHALSIILSSAALRDDGAAPLPERMTDTAPERLAATLIEKGFVREVRARADTPVWRLNEEGRACALIVIKLGRKTIRVRR